MSFVQKLQKQKMVFVLVVILFMQLMMMMHFAEAKAGYYEDELYTYDLANYQNTFVCAYSLNEWHSGSFYVEALTANNEKRFDFSIPYHNQENDVHPPLYYFLIHFLSSLFPGVLSKWIGIASNIIFCLLTTILLFLICKKIVYSDMLALIVSASWALSVGAMSTAVFIRMYAMLTMECALFYLVHLNFFEQISNYKTKKFSFLGLFFITLAGILTQYYFMIFAFFLCLCFLILLLVWRKWKLAIIYTINEFLAILFAILLFPKLLYHIFGGYRGLEAFQNLYEADSYLEDLKKVIYIINHHCFNGYCKEILFILFILSIFAFIFKYLLECKLEKNNNGIYITLNINLNNQKKIYIDYSTFMFLILLCATTLYVLLIVKIAPAQVDRYYMCVFPFICVIFWNLVYKVVSLFIKKSQKVLCVVLVLVSFVTLYSYKVQDINYLYLDYKLRSEQLSQYNNIPVILLNGRNYDAYAVSFAYDYKNNVAVYQCGAQNFEDLSKATQIYDLSDGFLLYAISYDNISENELFNEINKYIDVATYELITSIGCRVYFCRLDTEETFYEYSADFYKYPFVSNGFDSDGARYLYNGGISYGPYIDLVPGSYRIYCSGSELDKLSFDSVYKLNNELVWLNLLNVQQDKDHISYEIILTEEINNYETRFFNNTDLAVCIKSISITKEN